MVRAETDTKPITVDNFMGLHGGFDEMKKRFKALVKTPINKELLETKLKEAAGRAWPVGRPVTVGVDVSVLYVIFSPCR